MPKSSKNLSNLLFKKDKEVSVRDSLLETWHYLMVHYGYIPLEQFLDMDSAVVNSLIEMIDKMNKQEKKNMPKKKGGKKFK